MQQITFKIGLEVELELPGGMATWVILGCVRSEIYLKWLGDKSKKNTQTFFSSCLNKYRKYPYNNFYVHLGQYYWRICFYFGSVLHCF